jgi:hypothetical protein
MIGCLLTDLIVYGVPLYYSLIAVKLGGAAPEENKKWSVYWLITFILLPVFYVVGFLGWYCLINLAQSLLLLDFLLLFGFITLNLKEHC